MGLKLPDVVARALLLPACKIFIAILFFLHGNRANSQVLQPKQILPPPPEAASLFKFTEVPVSYYSGLANTSIPLYNIKAGSLTIPVSVNYHGRGVRVEEIASRVGIGWALSAGGMISRQIRGKADDYINGYAVLSYYDNLFTDPNVAANIYNTYVDGTADLEPDMFMLEAAGLSGKFMFDQHDHQPVLQNYSDTKIVPIWIDTKIRGWVVTDNSGNKFYFGLSKDQTRSAVDSELVHNYSFSQSLTDLFDATESPINAWHLMEIETSTNEKVEFTYEAETPVYWRRQYDEKKSSIPNGARSFFGRVESVQHQVKEISFSTGKLRFVNSAAPRQDLLDAYPLGRVEVLDKNNLLVKGFVFGYDYPATIIDLNNTNEYLGNIDPRAAKRMFLKSILEYGNGGLAVPPYEFTYSDQPLPNRHSNSQDAWGFYNGANNGHFLTFFPYGTTQIDRAVDTVKAEAGLLKEITYPTGGSVSFTYEHNKGIPPPFLSQLLITNPNPYEEIGKNGGFLKHPQYFNGVNAYTNEFVVGPDRVGLVNVRFDLPFCNSPENDDPDLCRYSFSIVGEGQAYGMNPAVNGGTLNLALAPGTYRATVTALGEHDPNAQGNLFFLSISWTERRVVENVNNLIYSAGKRIKKIEYKDGDGTAKVKQFEYLNPATAQSSGRIFGLPNFHFIEQFVGGIYVVDKYGSLPGSPLTSLQGNGVGYSHVTEFFGDATTNQGKIEHEFTIFEDGGEYWKKPFFTPIDNEWLRGKVLSTRVYEKSTTGYVKKKETINKYSYAGRPNVSGIFYTPFLPVGQNAVYSKDRKNFYLPLVVFVKDTIAPYSYKVFYQTGGAMDMYQATEKEYENGDSLTAQTDYLYNYDKHYLSNGNKTVNSKGDSLFSNSFYPPDISPRTAAEQKLIDLNRIAIVIRSETIQGSATTGKITNKAVYKDYGSNIVLPEFVQSANNAEALQTDVQFLSYDNLGHPTEVVQKDGVHVAYLWGYSSQYPVAKVVNSTYSTINGFINQTMLANAHQYTDQAIRDELNKIRIGLANTTAQVTTYTYRMLRGLSSETDARGRTVFYEYDGLGRLLLVRDHENNLVKKINYAYASVPQGFTNTAQSGNFTRNNCSNGPGSTVVYTVPAGRYTSFVDTADANQQARNEVNLKGQAYADSAGICRITIYATISENNTQSIFEDDCLRKVSNIIVRFYSNAAHTIPYSVSNLPIQIVKGSTLYLNGTPGNTSYTTTNYTVTGTSFTLSGETIYYGCASNCPESPCLPLPNDPNTRYVFTLQTNTFNVFP